MEKMKNLEKLNLDKFSKVELNKVNWILGGTVDAKTKIKIVAPTYQGTDESTSIVKDN
jgi:hypothetical protein